MVCFHAGAPRIGARGRKFSKCLSVFGERASQPYMGALLLVVEFVFGVGAVATEPLVAQSAAHSFVVELAGDYSDLVLAGLFAQ